MDRNIIQRILIGLFFGACIFFGLKTFDFTFTENLKIPGMNQIQSIELPTASTVSSSKMTYGRFLEYLDMGWVNQVDLYDNGRNAIVQASSPELGNRPQSIRVEIPIGASQLIQKLKENNINFDAHP